MSHVNLDLTPGRVYHHAPVCTRKDPESGFNVTGRWSRGRFKVLNAGLDWKTPRYLAVLETLEGPSAGSWVVVTLADLAEHFQPEPVPEQPSAAALDEVVQKIVDHVSKGTGV